MSCSVFHWMQYIKFYGFEGSTHGKNSCVMVARSGQLIKNYGNDTFFVETAVIDWKVYSLLIEAF